jgi:hypothetical protein
MLPRQARDKHRKSKLRTKGRFLAAVTIGGLLAAGDAAGVGTAYYPAVGLAGAHLAWRACPQSTPCPALPRPTPPYPAVFRLSFPLLSSQLTAPPYACLPACCMPRSMRRERRAVDGGLLGRQGLHVEVHLKPILWSARLCGVRDWQRYQYRRRY